MSDERSLLYNTFLVVPLLPTGGFCKEQRFSGNSEIGQNDEDYVGMMIDAFAHHVVEDANGEYMLADIQGMCCLYAPVAGFIQIGCRNCSV